MATLDPYLYYTTAAEAQASGYSSPAEARYEEWIKTASIGDTFDLYQNAPTFGNIGLSTTLTGYTPEGAAMLQTNVSPEKADWRGAISTSQNFDAAVEKLISLGYDAGFAAYLAKADGFTSTNTSGAGTGSTSTTSAMALLQAQISTLTAAQTSASTLAAQKLAVQAQDAISVLTDRFAKYGLSSLVGKIKELAISGATEATIQLQLAETPEYQARFKANAERLKNNLTVLSPGDYLAAEDTYRQILRAYGLRQFDTDEYVSQFIANDVSPTELSNRVVTAVQRVQNADPAVAKTLRDYYGIGSSDMVAYVLDPQQQFQKIQRQVAAAEIGSAARVQGLEAGVTVAEQLAAQGVTQAEAQKGYATIADILPTSEKLSQIYGSTMDTYGQSQAEQEVFNSLASAQRARQRLTGREVAQFSSSSGTSKSSLTQGTTAGQI